MMLYNSMGRAGRSQGLFKGDAADEDGNTRASALVYDCLTVSLETSSDNELSLQIFERGVEANKVTLHLQKKIAKQLSA